MDTGSLCLCLCLILNECGLKLETRLTFELNWEVEVKTSGRVGGVLNVIGFVRNRGDVFMVSLAEL
jgi:hypothetical protein